MRRLPYQPSRVLLLLPLPGAAALRSADGRYVQPDAAAAAIVPSAIKELGAEAEAQGWDADWSFLAERAPTTYPLAFWGFAALPADLTGEGARGLYVRDSGARGRGAQRCLLELCRVE